MNLFLHLKQLHPTVHIQFRDTPPEVTEQCIKAGDDLCSSAMGKDIAVIRKYSEWLIETFAPNHSTNHDLIETLLVNIKRDALKAEVNLLEANIYQYNKNKERLITTVEKRP